MHLVALTVLLLIAAALTSKDDPAKGYHRLEGIPTAARIKDREDHINSERNSRIFSSDNVIGNFDQYSFHAGLIINLPESLYSYCGSSLLNYNRLVTAAHCWDDGVIIAINLTIVLGTPYLFHGGLRINTTEFIVHPEYDRLTLKNDIAIVKFPYILHNSSIFPIAIPDDTMPPINDWQLGLGRVVGFEENKSSDSKLRVVDVRFIPITECQKVFNFPLDRENQFCVETEGKQYKASCTIDSGAPLVAYSRPYLIGVLTARGDPWCENRGMTLFTRLHSPLYTSFIKSHVVLPQFEFRYAFDHTVNDVPVALENITMSVNYNYNNSYKYNILDILNTRDLNNSYAIS